MNQKREKENHRPTIWIGLYQHPISINGKHVEKVSEFIYLDNTVSATRLVTRPKTQSVQHLTKAFPSPELMLVSPPKNIPVYNVTLLLTALYASKTWKRQWQATASSTPSTKHASDAFLKLRIEYWYPVTNEEV
jgi:hypothetical protein